jgi:hypothetical protein
MIKLTPKLRDLLGTHGEPNASLLASPLFITGAMRSGTTYLVNKLAAHPQLLKIGSELNQVWTDIGGAPIKGHCPHLTEHDASPYFTYQMANYISSYIAESKTLKRHLARASKRLDTNLFRVTYDWESIIPVNKSPHLMNKLRYVHALFPNSKFIVIVRDIYGHSASMKHHFMSDDRLKYMPSEPTACWSIAPKSEFQENPPSEKCYPPNFNTIPEMWFRLNELALREAASLPENQVLVLSYEALITEEHNTLERVFSFLGLKEKHRKEEEKIKALAAKKMNTSTAGNPLNKWKKTMNEQEIAAIEKVIDANADQYNYIQQRIAQG